MVQGSAILGELCLVLGAPAQPVAAAAQSGISQKPLFSVNRQTVFVVSSTKENL